MDPLSIVCAAGALAKAAYVVSSVLYNFISDTKNIDQSAKLLYDEVEGLITVLYAIDRTRSNSVIKSDSAAAESHDGLWQSIDGSLMSCRETVDLLNRSLKSVKARRKSRNIFKQSFRQLELNFKQSDMAQFRSHVQAHCMHLQMALQMVNVFISCNAPAIVIADLGPKMDRLEYMVANIDLSRMNQASFNLGRSKLPNFTNQEDQLKKSAKAILSNASSVLETQSEWVGSRKDETTGSEFGKPLSYENFSKIESWIPRPTVQEEPLEEIESSESHLTSSFNQARSSFTPPTSFGSDSVMKHQPNLNQVNIITSDSEDDFEYELVQKFLSQGQEKYERGDFRDAEVIFRRGLEHAEKLSMRKRDQLKLKDVKYKIGISCFKQNRLNESIRMLLPLSEETVTGPEDIVRKLDASHSLAQVFLARRTFEDARTYCKKSMSGRRQYQGKEHPKYLKSLILLGSIYKLQGDLVTAAVVADLLPQEFADARRDLGAHSASLPSQIDNILKSTVTEPPDTSISVAFEKEQEILRPSSENGNENDFHGQAHDIPDLEHRFLRRGSKLAMKGLEKSQDYLHDPSANSDSKFENIYDSDENEPCFLNSQERQVASKILDSRTYRPGTGMAETFFWACDIGQFHAVALCLERGFDVNTQDKDGFTALTYAVLMNDFAAVKMLLESGADVDIKDSHGCTALLSSIRHGWTKVFRLLLEYGANPEITSQNGSTSLLAAVASESDEMVSILLDKSVEIEAKDIFSQTPLMVAALGGANDILERLLGKGANLEARGVNGSTALVYAIQSGNISTIKRLLDAGADVKSKDSSGMTPLMRAVEKGNLMAVHLLLQKNRNINVRNQKGKTAWDLAKTGEIKDLLIDFEFSASNTATTMEASTHSFEPP